MNLLITGVQGSGKTTHAKKLAEKYDMIHISTGNLLRKHIKEKTKIGIEYEKAYEKGELAPNELLFTMIEEALNESTTLKKGFILDGFPRNKEQLHWLLDQEIKIDRCIDLIIEEKIATERMLARGRKDDTPEAIKKRISDYWKKTYCVNTYYESRRRVFTVSTGGAIEDTFKEIELKLDLDSKLYSRLHALEKELADINETKIKKLSITEKDILVVRFPDYRMPRIKMEEYMRKNVKLLKETLKEKIKADVPILAVTHGMEFEVITFEDWEKEKED